MGQTLSEPITTKETACCASRNFIVGSSCMQGWRTTMEDAHTHLLALPDDPSTAFFAVYDGHGGSRVSQYAGVNLHQCIAQQPGFAEGKIERAISRGFLEIDQRMKADDEMKDDMSGTTAVVVIVRDNVIYCGNVGDSRAVVSITGTAVPLSYDHKPANEGEAARIVAAGGWVEFNRVNGNLALSRALGDFAFKRCTNKTPEEQMVTAFPDVIREEITPNHEFILLACDGIWDVMSNQEVVDFCRERLAAGIPPQTICEELLSRCLAPDCQMGGLGCDNMTAVLVALTQGETAQSLAAKCSRPREEVDETSEAGRRARDYAARDRGELMEEGDLESEIQQQSVPETEMYHTPQPSPGINAGDSSITETKQGDDKVTDAHGTVEKMDEEKPPMQFHT